MPIDKVYNKFMTRKNKFEEKFEDVLENLLINIDYMDG